MSEVVLPHLVRSHAGLYTRTLDLASGPLASAADRGAAGRVNRELIAALAEHGLIARLFPRAACGTPGRRISATELCILRESLARGCTQAETALALQGLGGYPILLVGSPELQAAWLPRVASGELVAAFALTEPEAGSDAAALSLAAERDGGCWRLTGTKKWISNAPEADLYTVFARTTPDAGAHGVTAFVVPGDSKGLGGQALELIAPHPVGTLELDGVVVGPENVLGEVDGGFKVAMETLDLFRPSVGAFAVGMAQAALDAAVEHAGERKAFGGNLRALQAVSHRLAEMATRIAAARLLVYEAAATYEAGERSSGAAAMAKLFATETAQWVIDGAIQIHGARALEKGHLLEHLYRDVRPTRIYEGASEIQREVIARELYR
jgi:alkylation response protein AidB-like acyl-CoA dehydrogenase